MDKIITQDVWIIKERVDLNDPKTIAAPIGALQKLKNVVVLTVDEFNKIKQLPVKFGEWKDKNYYAMENRTAEGYYYVAYMVNFIPDKGTANELYTYWLKNIYQPE